MSKKEAKSILQALVTHYNAFSQESEALCVAIDALEEENRTVNFIFNGVDSKDIKVIKKGETYIMGEDL